MLQSTYHRDRQDAREGGASPPLPRNCERTCFPCRPITRRRSQTGFQPVCFACSWNTHRATEVESIRFGIGKAAEISASQETGPRRTAKPQKVLLGIVTAKSTRPQEAATLQQTPKSMVSAVSRHLTAFTFRGERRSSHADFHLPATNCPSRSCSRRFSAPICGPPHPAPRIRRRIPCSLRRNLSRSFHPRRRHRCYWC